MSVPRQVARAVGSKSREPGSVLPVGVVLDDSDTPHDVVDALILSSFSSGEQPWAHTARLDRIRSDASLLPPDARVVRSATQEGTSWSARLAVGEGWTLRAVRWRNGGGEVTVTAVSEELARTVLRQATDGAVAEPPADDASAVEVGFWYLSTRHGAYRTTRTISTASWADIRRNYAGAVAGALDDLMAVTPEHITGRLILLHGQPGTGKTTALRTLAREWRGWCRLDCVLDPERLFSDPTYLMDLVIGDDDDDEDGSKRWRLLLLEDCDELIRAEAKESTGQALSRLLNVTDGMLGQGRRILVGITTNENLARLHPAVVRPGRCLAQIEISALARDEAVAWLGRADGVGPTGATLAELYALRTGHQPVALTRPDPSVGMYL